MTVPSSHHDRGGWVTLPNVITLVRLALVIPIALFIVQDIHPKLTVVLVFGFGLSDWLDGYLARKFGQTSRVGAMLDPVADRIGVGVIVGALVMADHLHPGIVVVILAADGALGIAYLLTMSFRVPVISRLGKVRTAILMAGLAATTLALLPPLEALASVGAILCTVGAGLHVMAGAGYLRDIAHRPRYEG